eukprot:4750086-Prymnesium_polylepis.2
MVTYVESLEEYCRLVNRKGVYTILDFTATWCGPCQKIAPVFEELASNYSKTELVEFYKIDVDENQDAASQSKVNKMPTFQVFHEGELIYVLEGANEADVRRLVELTTQRSTGVITNQDF